MNKQNKERGSGGGVSLLTGFLLVLAGLWVLWYLTGGEQRAQKEGNAPFIQDGPNGATYNSIGH